MAVVRFIGLLFIVLALMFLGADLVSSFEMPGAFYVRSFDHILMLMRIDAKPFIEHSFPVWLLSASLAVLSLPGWAIFSILGVLASLLGVAGLPPQPRAPKTPAIHR